MNINEAQKKAIAHDKGPMLVLAGPGSGKTFVITMRTKYLIEEHGVDPRHILVITFTKAAAEEMKERFTTIMGGENPGVHFGTFHAIFFKILKYAYHYNASNIIREEDRYRTFSHIIQKMQLEIEDEKEFLEGISAEISLVKGEGVKIEHYHSLNCSDEIFQQIYREYESQLAKAKLIDFDDMVLMCYELLSKRPDILKLWQGQYQFFMVDEAQDSNRLQFEIMKLLSRETRNLTVIGDDDQSLYRFRGAKPEILLNFHEDYPERVLVLLDKNYRSQAKIIQGALQVIRNNKKRFEKEIMAVRQAGSDIEVNEYKTLQEENRIIVDRIKNMHEKGTPYRNIAVLYRTNTQPRALIGSMMEFNIPFRMKDAMPNIYEHWIAKNIIAYIEIALGGRDRGIFLSIINRPKRYITRDSFELQTVEFRDLKQYYADKGYVIERIEKLEYDIKMLEDMSPYAAIHYIRKGIGYDDYIKEYAEYRRMKMDDLYDVLDELQENAKEFNTYEEWFLHMEEYKRELQEQLRKRNRRDNDSVALMTFHGAKGLEFETVFILEANEGITPHGKAISEEDIEEERRMFYVAMTRAKDNLIITYVKERYNKELLCSRFVGELLLNREELQEGIIVKHKTYGVGKVVQVDKGKIKIHFDNTVFPKTLSLEVCVQNNLLTISKE